MAKPNQVTITAQNARVKLSTKLTGGKKHNKISEKNNQASVDQNQIKSQSPLKMLALNCV
jgi:hypothetical protein